MIALRTQAPCRDPLTASTGDSEAQVRRNHWNQTKRKKRPVYLIKSLLQQREDFRRAVNVLAAHDPHIGHLVALAKNPGGRNLPRKFIRNAWIARNDNRKNPPRAQKPIKFGYRARKVGEVLKYVHRDRTIEISILELCSLLTGSRCHSHCRKALPDFGRHIFPQLNAMVFLPRKVLEFDMAADAGADFYRAKMRLIREIPQRILMIEALDGSVSIRQDTVPILHPVIHYGVLSVAERRGQLGPGISRM